MEESTIKDMIENHMEEMPDETRDRLDEEVVSTDEAQQLREDRAEDIDPAAEEKDDRAADDGVEAEAGERAEECPEDGSGESALEAVDGPDGESSPEKESLSKDTAGETAEDEGDDEAEADADESPLPLASVVEAVLFAAREPLKVAQIARAVGKRTRQEAVRQAIEELNVQYLEASRAFEIAEISGRYQLMSRPEYARHIMRIYPKRELSEKDKTHRLTPTALDTLAIIAYKQPVTRGEIEHIRGVACGNILKTLIERGTVRVAGKRTDLVGQPRVYGTTEAFLAEFGLGSLDELPLRNDFLGILGDEQGAVELFPESGEASSGPEESPTAESGNVPETSSDMETECQADEAVIQDESGEEVATDGEQGSESENESV